MKTIQVQNGDIQLDTGGKLVFLQGSQKLIQDLSLWLQEDLGAGYTTPNFGSTLNSLIGGPNIESTVAMIQSEVQRILGLYQAQQLLDLQSAQSKAALSNWNKSEIINQINSVTAEQSYSSVIVNVSLTTLANVTMSLKIIVDPTSGVQVTNG